MSFLTSREQVAPQGIGKPVRRREDVRLLTGGGRFADEMNLPGQGYACMVRSPHAHALIGFRRAARGYRVFKAQFRSRKGLKTSQRVAIFVRRNWSRAIAYCSSAA